jgi:hypothetical protein
MATTADDATELNVNENDAAPRTRMSLVPSRQGNYSLFCLSDQNCLRRAARLIVEWRYPFYEI